jgi:hypothetical protein
MVLRMIKSRPSRNPVFTDMYFTISRAQTKKKIDLTWASMQKYAFRDLGFGLGPGLAITFYFNLSMIHKKEFIRIKWLTNI